ncbi:unnamed protein product, partial [Anisakis simplex]|uniref:Inosine-uridine preferring nucleoside hydrolase n=1 Tax=Anisakis simplex TaxID=6269 RepID=A0A0M3JQC4_ANISI
MGSQFTAEFNFGGDPEAAHIVIDKMRCPVTLVPWEAIIFDGLKHQKEIDFEAHLGAGTPLADFFSTITAIGREVMHKNGRQYCYVDEIA